jgi:two-component system sensor histidine kinase KdpD
LLAIQLSTWLRTPVSRTSIMAWRLAAVTATIAAITLVGARITHINATTIGFAYLIGVLVVATRWGLTEALLASFLAVLCFNFFFLPPLRTWTIADPQNWVAFFAFLATAIIASQLSARARQRTQEALDRQKEMERLYALSRAILLADASDAPAKRIADRIREIFDFPALALYDCTTGQIHRSGVVDLPDVDDALRMASEQEKRINESGGSLTVIPIHLSGRPMGSLAISGVPLSDAALQALCNLVAVTLEKVRGQEAANRAEAARQSQELKSTLLDALAHEFKTPLTAIKAAATELLSSPGIGAEEQHELTTVVDEEADRLGRLVTEAIQMARIEAGKIRLKTGLYSVEALIRPALQQMNSMTEGRTVSVNIAGGMPLIAADQELMGMAIRQLLDNALKYSPAGSPIAVAAEKTPHHVLISVSDQGPGIRAPERSRIFERFYRSPGTPQNVTGAGMGLAIALEIVRAHGGDIQVENGPAGGAKFSIAIPAAEEEIAT